MNFLAHMHLSQDDDQLMVGNFIGDHVKGRKWEKLPAGIAEGVLMHRFIDSFTDEHPINRAVCRSLSPYFKRWTPVALDIIWDYFLASEWENWSEDPLHAFTVDVYSTMDDYTDHFPERATEVLFYMRQTNWLLSYASLEGVDQAFRGMWRRIQHENSLNLGAKAIEENRQMLSENFNEFFPDLIQACQEWLNSRKA